MARFTVWFMNLATLFESKHWLDLRLVIITNYEKNHYIIVDIEFLILDLLNPYLFVILFLFSFHDVLYQTC